jgi:thiol-disulfide isomerase/thioredoxin
MFQELGDDTLAQIVNDNEIVMVQYGASWCGNCRIMKPKFKKLAAENEEIPFFYVDAEKLTESRQLAKVDNLPHFCFIQKWSIIQTSSNQSS